MKQSFPKVIYIGGYGRSGSTLLDILLGIHPQIVSSGELVRFLAEMDVQGARCSCGDTTAVCGHWKSRFTHVSGVLRETGQSLKKAQSVQRKADSGLRLIGQVFGLSLPNEDAARYRAVQRALFESVASNTRDAKYVVDSSNTTSHWGGRPLALASVAGCSVHFIHLVRNPEAVLASLMRGLNRDLERGDFRVERYTVIKGLLGWIRANMAGLLTAGLMGEKKYILLRYEDLIHKPEPSFSRLSAFLNVTADPWMAVARGERLMRDWHIFSGNRMRHGDVRLNPELAEESVPSFYRYVALALCWPLMRRFGY